MGQTRITRMAKFSIIFYGSEESVTNKNELQCFKTDEGVSITINTGNYEKTSICLDRSTAIKFSKELRKQIFELGEEVVVNG